MAQKIFDKDFIFNRIRDSKFLFWSLALVEGFKNFSNVMQYYGNDFEDTDTEETKIEKSINKLDAVLQSFPPNCTFQIEIKASKQANGSGIVGPFQFTNCKEETPETALNGLAVPRGYIHESMLKGIEERIRNDFETRLENYKIESEKERQKEEFERKMSELDEREKRLKELEKGYNSGVAKTADVLVEAGKKILTYFMQAVPTQAAQTQPAALGQAPEPQDEKTQALDNLAEFLYNNYDVNTINNLYKSLKNATTTEKQNQHVTSNVQE